MVLRGGFSIKKVKEWIQLNKTEKVIYFIHRKCCENSDRGLRA